MTHYVYDIETYPNAFTCVVKHIQTGQRWIFEASDRVNQLPQFAALMRQIPNAVGYNNEAFDYPVVHMILQNPALVTVADIYNKAMSIIDSQDRFAHTIWPRDRLVRQIDLFKIMHFDNMARATSLKKLEMAMRAWSVRDLPFPPGTILTDDDIDILIEYNCVDVDETVRFALEIWSQIEFRDELTRRYPPTDFTNFNDTKIGKQFFISKLQQSGIACYDDNRQPRQTHRFDGIKIADVLIPLEFRSPDLTRVYDFFKDATIYETNGIFSDLSADLGGFQLDFGTGGIHGSVSRQTVRGDLIDVDVTSYYPSLAIANRFYPAHLGESFCDIYASLKEQRAGYAKGTPENAMLKLALNGVYGDSNNPYSPFYDPQYTMAITINGQMLLAKLAEELSRVGRLIQVNTDGVTVQTTREKDVRSICMWWESFTGLTLEFNRYDRMFIRDVNNYLAVGTDGKVKRKGAYEYDVEWHQDHSSLIVPKAVENHLVNGADLIESIFECADPYDFLRHVKVPRSSRLMHGDTQVQNASRYFIAKDGYPLVKVMPPLAKKPDFERRIGIDVGWQTLICNYMGDWDWNNLNRSFYVMEAKKLAQGVKG